LKKRVRAGRSPGANANLLGMAFAAGAEYSADFRHIVAGDLREDLAAAEPKLPRRAGSIHLGCALTGRTDP
jgi:hypothetical protein